MSRYRFQAPHCKEGNLCSGIYDHIDMRFVTHDDFSTIMLIKFARSRHVFRYANVSPLESKNSLAECHQIEALFAEISGPVESDPTTTGRQAWPGGKKPTPASNSK